jgi:hypothetical protein
LLAGSGDDFDYEEARKEVYRRLIRDPFCLRPEEISRLTDYQIGELFNKEPRAPGETRENEVAESYWETIRRVYLNRGWKEEEIRQLWKRDQLGEGEPWNEPRV